MHVCDLWKGVAAACCLAQVKQVVAQVQIQHSRLQLLSIRHIPTSGPEPSWPICGAILEFFLT